MYHSNRYVSVEKFDKKYWYATRLYHHMWRMPNGIVIEDPMCGSHVKCRVRCLPYYIVLGLAKCGTTDFNRRIHEHPLIFNTVMKEPFYWSHIRFLINATIGDYADFFDYGLNRYISKPFIDEVTGKKYYPYISGELSSFTFTDDAWWMEQPGNEGQLDPKYLKVHDMYSVLPDTKLIVLLRNPTTRLYSSYNMYRQHEGRHNPRDFHMRVLKSIEWWHNCTVLKQLPRRRCIYGSPPEMPPLVADLGNRWYGETNVANYSAALMKGMYAVIAKDWLSIYPREQFLAIKTEEYAKDPSRTFNEVVFPYLGVPLMNNTEVQVIENKDVANQRAYEPMLPHTKQILDDFYEPFNRELADLLGDDKWLWKD